MDEKVKWTNLTRREISEEMRKKGIQVSRNIVKKLLKKHNYVKRKALKKKLLAQTKIGINNSTKSLDCAKNMKTALIR
jgi:transposase-like protein